MAGGESASAFALIAHEAVRDRLRQVRRQGDAEAGAEGAVVGQAAGEVAVHDDRGAGGQMLTDVGGGGEQRGEVERHPGLDVVPCVDLPAQRLVERGNGGDEDGTAGRGEQRRNRGLPGAA